jgi:large subunit ribosomal protein L31
MKTGIHPEYHIITVTCACGNTFETGSTLAGDMRVEICANCHPLYTGKSKLIDTAGRVDKFHARQEQAEKRQAAASARAAKKADQPAAEANDATK